MATTAAPKIRGEPKLRDSCNACSHSKVKCDKEKPTCGRCTKRGSTCEYVANKRAGRKPDRRQETQAVLCNNDATIFVTTDATPHPKLLDLISKGSSSNTFGDEDVQMSHSESQHIVSPVLAPQETLSWWGLDSLLMDLDDTPQAPVSAPDFMTHVPESHSTQSMGSMSRTDSIVDSAGELRDFTLDDFGAFLEEELSAQADSPLPTPPISRHSPFTWQMPAHDSPAQSTLLPSLFGPAVTAQHAFPGAEPHRKHSCITGTLDHCFCKATQLLQRLSFVPGACGFHDSSTTSYHESDQKPHKLTSVITNNKRIIQKIHKILDCPCAKDDSGYLLAIVSLIIFRILDWYQIAMQETTEPTTNNPHIATSSTKVGTVSPQHGIVPQHSGRTELTMQGTDMMNVGHADHQPRRRMAAQLILSELHRVQQLINVLAFRLRQNVGENTVPYADATRMITSFSPAWMAHLEVDLRERTRTLSLELVALLK